MKRTERIALGLVLLTMTATVGKTVAQEASGPAPSSVVNGRAPGAATSPSSVRGALELFLYLPPSGYGPVVPVSLLPRNRASYGLALEADMSWQRIPRFVVILAPQLLLGDSGNGDRARYDWRVVAARAQYGIGWKLSHRVQLRLTHEEWLALDGPPIHAMAWNSVSLRLEGKPLRDHPVHYPGLDLGEIHYFPAHNEYDPSPALPFAERVVARYAVRIDASVPFTESRKTFAFVRSLTLLGDSRPQLSYNHSARPHAVRLEYGLGLVLTGSVQLRLDRGEWRDLGGYRGGRQLWNGVSIRWLF